MGLAPTNYIDHNDSVAIHLLVVLYACHWSTTVNIPVIIESVDSISRDGPDIAIYVIHYKNLNNSEQLKF